MRDCMVRMWLRLRRAVSNHVRNESLRLVDMRLSSSGIPEKVLLLLLYMQASYASQKTEDESMLYWVSTCEVVEVV